MVCLNCGGSRHYHKINTCQLMLVQAETFPNQALDTVSVVSVPDIAFGNRQTQSRMTQAIDPSQHRQTRIRRFLSLLEYPLESGGIEQAAGSRETVASRSQRTQTVKLFRPLARRALMTRRPPRVFMRARKPWVRTRLILLG